MHTVTQVISCETSIIKGYIMGILCVVYFRFTVDDPFLQNMMQWQRDVEKENSSPLLFLVVFLKFMRHFPFRIFKIITEFRDMWLGYLGKNIDDHMAKYNPGTSTMYDIIIL